MNQNRNNPNESATSAGSRPLRTAEHAYVRCSVFPLFDNMLA